MKINDVDLYKIKAITKTKKYLDWERDFKQKYNLTDVLKKSGLMEPEEEQILSTHLTRSIRDKKNFESEYEYYYTSRGILWYLNKHRNMRVDIEILLSTFGLVPNEKLTILVLYYVLFGEYTPPFFGLIKLEFSDNNEIKLVIDKHASKEDWNYIWDVIQGKLNGSDSAIDFIDAQKTRTKEWKTFDRDLEIYILYHNLKRDSEELTNLNKRNLTWHSKESKSIYRAIMASSSYARIKKKYHLDDFVDDEKLISASLTFCKRVLKDLPLF